MEPQGPQPKSGSLDGNSMPGTDLKGKGPQNPPGNHVHPHPPPHQLSSVRAAAKPSAQKSNKSRVAKKIPWFKKPFRCFSKPDKDSDSSENDDIDAYIQNSGGTFAEEAGIVARLQVAVNDLVRKPTTYEIESEIIKWQKMLEIEQKMYEEHGVPRFKYKIFRKNKYLMVKQHPLYGTDYENHRKLETRLREFRFGASPAIQKRLLFDDDIEKNKTGYLRAGVANDDDGSEGNAAFWRTDTDTFFASFALLCSASNFFRFPQACSKNGGFTFIFTYGLMVAAVGQPLLYFEMLLGQYSLNGPMGFSKLHPYAKGIPYAVAFVCVVFGTSRSIFLAYSLLYSLLSIIASPGECGWWESGRTICIPYYDLGILNKQINETRAKHSGSLFSVELFFREVLDPSWETGGYYSFIHLKLTGAFLIASILAYIPVHYNLTGKSIRNYLYYSLILPIMVLLVFIHQVFKRGVYTATFKFFFSIDWDHVSFLGIWSESLEMMLSTLGIGYGYHWAISGRTKFDYRETYRTSWRICGYSVLFGLISSLVIFFEVGIVGAATGILKHHHVFKNPASISLLCFPGALIKVGRTNAFFLVMFFFLVFVFGMWSQIIIADIILQWFETGSIIKARSVHVLKRKMSSAYFVIGVQVAVISPYLFTQGKSVLASENLFGGSIAAYSVVLAELITAAYLYGFEQFSADLEIMTKRPLPALFQIQIRYIVIPTIMIVSISLIIDVTKNGPRRSGAAGIGYISLLANFTPVVIILVASQWKYVYGLTARKVHPEPFIYERPITYIAPVARMPVFESRFVGKVNAPSQTNSYPFRSELYQVTEHNMQYVYEAQRVVKKQLMDLIQFKRMQSRWILTVQALLSQRKIESMGELGRRAMFDLRVNNNKVDVRFLRKTLDQIVNLTFYSAVRKLQRMPLPALLPYLADELIMLTTFHEEEYHYHYRERKKESLGDSSEDVENNNANMDKSSSSSSSSLSVDGIREDEMHKRVYGSVGKSPQELRTLLTIRLKKGLNLPYDGELGVLRFLRRERAQNERIHSCWTINDLMPIDHFVPASISKGKDKICFTIFHAVVVEGNEHFALKKLPIPRPPIVRVTKAFVASQPGQTLTDKFAQIVRSRMLRNVKQIVNKRNLKRWPKHKVRRHLWKVADRVDDDVYDFLDRILTCVIVIVDGRKADGVKKPARKYYLTPRTRRKISEERILRTLKQQHADLEITTYSAIALKDMHVKQLIKLLEAPPDIVYHRFDSDDEEPSDHGSDDEVLDVKSSSGSSSSLSSDGDQKIPTRELESQVALGFYAAPRFTRKDKYILTNEKLQHRDRRDSFKTRKSITMDVEERKIRTSASKTHHISAKRWTRLRNDPEYGKYAFTETEEELQNAVDKEADRRATLSLFPTRARSVDYLNPKVHQVRRTRSFQSLRQFVKIERDSLVTSTQGIPVQNTAPLSENQPNAEDSLLGIDDRLDNHNPRLIYLSIGKTLIVDLGRGINSRLMSLHPHARSTASSSSSQMLDDKLSRSHRTPSNT